MLAFAQKAGGFGGVYGQAQLIDALYKGKFTIFGWQAAAMDWSNNKVSANAGLLQRANRTRPRIDGADYDEDLVLKANCGLWVPPVVAPKSAPAAPKPAPVIAPKPVVVTTAPPLTTSGGTTTTVTMTNLGQVPIAAAVTVRPRWWAALIAWLAHHLWP